MPQRPTHTSLWYFIGILLLIYGGLITGAGVWDLVEPPARPTVLAETHPAIWWGAILLAIGGIYVYCFSPRRNK